MKAKLLRRNAYGLDQKGESDDHQPMNLEDTSTPATLHKTPVNMVNTIRDSEAKMEFPWIDQHTHHFPSRGRG